MFQRYRRNSDSDIRDAERRFISTGSGNDYVAYLVACQRASLIPQWCSCRQRASVLCPACSHKNNVPAWHCAQCMQHACPGAITLPDGEERPCTQDLTEAPKCHVCGSAHCPKENCNQNEILNECHQCEKTFCNEDGCGGTCEVCSVAICSECWFECEAHNNNTFCSDCTMDCEYCQNKCCPECICADTDCGINICSSCTESDPDRAGVCHVCERPVCENHHLACDSCQESVCKEDSTRCRMKGETGKLCGAVICGTCSTEECSQCNKSGCEGHFEGCVECEQLVCFGYCSDECDNCGERVCVDCSDDHKAKCRAVEELIPSPITPPLLPTSAEIIQVGSRVRHATSQLLGIIIKISEKDGIPRYVVEWDDDSAGKHSREELLGPINLRRYRRY